MQQEPRARGRRVRRRVAALDPDRARPPRPVGGSSWLLPDPADADSDGVVGVGADLAPATLVDAYRRGIFPWPHPGVPLPWFSPDPRGVIPLDSVHVSRSLRRTLRRQAWTTTVDAAFDEVVRGCAAGRGAAGTWITPAMERAYRRLHALGWAHSVEVWSGGSLVGGIYGVQVGAVFTGESMFHRADDASKVALLDLAVRLRAAGGWLLDVQLTTEHLAALGAVDVARHEFLALLAQARERDVRLLLRRLPAARLAERSASAPPSGGSTGPVAWGQGHSPT